MALNWSVKIDTRLIQGAWTRKKTRVLFLCYIVMGVEKERKSRSKINEVAKCDAMMKKMRKDDVVKILN